MEHKILATEGCLVHILCSHQCPQVFLYQWQKFKKDLHAQICSFLFTVWLCILIFDISVVIYFGTIQSAYYHNVDVNQELSGFYFANLKMN